MVIEVRISFEKETRIVYHFWAGGHSASVSVGVCSPDFRTKGVWERMIDSEIGVLGTEATPKVTL